MASAVREKTEKQKTSRKKNVEATDEEILQLVSELPEISQEKSKEGDEVSLSASSGDERESFPSVEHETVAGDSVIPVEGSSVDGDHHKTVLTTDVCKESVDPSLSTESYESKIESEQLKSDECCEVLTPETEQPIEEPSSQEAAQSETEPSLLSVSECPHSESSHRHVEITEQRYDASGKAIECDPREQIGVGLYPDIDQLAMACNQSVKHNDVDVQPFTRDQMRSLYYNHQLEHQAEFEEVFLQELNSRNHPLYEILQNYYRARNALCSAEHDTQALLRHCQHHQEMVWETKTEVMVLQGQCSDKAKVTADHSYEVAVFSEAENQELSRCLKNVRCHLHDDLSLAAYEAQLSRLQVEAYLHYLYKDNPALLDFPRNAPVTARLAHQIDPVLSHQIAALKKCISVLFEFQRKPAKDKVFLTDIQKWLCVLVGTLLRTATLEDHLFVAHHLLRCPPGVGKWASSFLQVLPPGETTHSSWGSPLLDHTLTILAAILRPVKQREDVLYQLKVTLTPPADRANENPWIMVDSEGEEDEDPENGWWLLLENDVVALLSQLPIQDIFAHVLYITHTDEGRLWYNIERTNEAGFFKLIAFCSYFLDILSDGLQTYSQVRYRQLNKRLGRMISHTVHYVADHWENFHRLYSAALEGNSILHQLQIEVDHLCYRAVKHILSAQRLGSWQFLTDLPFWCISLDMMWRLLWLMHQGHIESSQGQNDDGALNYCRMLLEDVDTQHWFEEKLTRMPISEATFLLTTFANMARSRPLSDIHFIETVTCEIFEIAYVWNHTRELCSKPGRELLASISTKHPYIISTLLQTVHGSMDKVGMVSVYLFKELPLHLWSPREGDLALIREWLIDQPITSPHSHLARLILEKLNWDIDKQNQELFLDVSLHKKIAILIVETYKQHLAGKSICGLFTEGLGKPQSPTEELTMASWAWHLVMRLCLHTNIRPLPPSDVMSDTQLQPVLQGYRDRYSIATYTALIIGKQSHDLSDFCSEGIRMLALLAEKNHYIPVVRALALIMPMFFSNPASLTSNKEFMHIIQNILAADSARKSYFSWEFPGPVTKLFCEMIVGELTSLTESAVDSLVHDAITFWLTVLVNVNTWNKDRNVLYVIDKINEVCFTSSSAWDVILQFFYKKIKSMQPSEREAGVFSSLTSWLSPSPSSPTLIDTPSCPEFPWFAYAALNAETLLEEESGLWAEVQSNMATSHCTVDQALKKSVSSLKLENPIQQAHRLCIYRWAQQALETSDSHPLLPLLWQRFFGLYLGRNTNQQGVTQRGSVGERFFDSTTYNTLIKRMKKRLTDTASHCHQVASGPQTDNASGDFDTSSSSFPDQRPAESLLHMQALVKCYQTFSFWLDEPRLHDASLYLPALPPQYDANRLLLVFNNDKTLWKEFVDMTQIERELDDLSSTWKNYSSHDLQAEHWLKNNEDDIKLNATQRILKRLAKCEDRTEPPPLDHISSPLPFLDPSILIHQQNLLYALRSDFSSLVDFAKNYCLRVSRLVGLDMTLVELHPDLLKNEMTEATVAAPCRSSFNPLHKCKGPAAISIRYEAKARNEITSRKIDENRAEYNQLLIEAQLPPPQILCAAAVHVEDAIKKLITIRQSDSSPQYQNLSLEVGTALFYHMAGFVSEDTKYYPPTRQFFASCIEILGQEFIHNNPRQSQPLLASILQMPSLLSLLAPNFTPNASPELFVTMYEDLLPIPHNQGPEVTFTLLTKFDIMKWLDDTQPVLSERSKFISVLSNAIYACGPQPKDTMEMVFQMYRYHLQQSLHYRFPDHFGEVLKIVIQGWHDESLSVLVWEDFLACLGCSGILPSGEFNIGDLRLQQITQQLSPITLSETIEWLGNYFMRERISRQESASYGLYPKWKGLIPHLSSFFQFLITNFISTKHLQVRSNAADPEVTVHEIWLKIVELYAPWIQPLDNNDQILNPCILNDLEHASQMTLSFVCGVSQLQTAFEDVLPEFSQGALSHMWPFYVTTFAKQGVPDHILLMLHKNLIQLPWVKFWPSIQAVQMMLQLQDHPVCCGEFLGRMVTLLNWPEIVRHSVAYDVPDITQHLHTALLDLLVQLSTHDVLLQETNLPHLMAAAESFNWNFLAAASFDSTVTWFLAHADPKCVIAERSARSSQILGLLKIASGFFMMPPGPTHAETPVKRNIYMRCIIQLLSKCSHLKDVSPDCFNVILINLLSETEAVVGSIPDASCQNQEALSLSSELLSSLNTCNPCGGSSDAILRAFLGWLDSSPSSPLLLPLLQSSCRCIASIPHMVRIVEACMQSYFCQPGVENTETKGWSSLLAVLQAPETNRKEFLREAVVNGSYLCLFAFVLQQLPLSQSMVDEKRHIDVMVDWTCMVKPSGQDGHEIKLVLWWMKILELIQRQLDFSGDVRGCIQALLKLIPGLMALGEDRASSGLMGAIGLGKKSQLSTKFRLLCRALATFLAAQIPSDVSLRQAPNAPGYLADSAKKRPSSGCSASQSAIQCLQQLEALRSNKHYSQQKHLLDFCISFTTNPANNIRDSRTLLLQMLQQMYTDVHYLAILWD